MVNLASFWKPEAFGQTVLPDRSILKGQKLVENDKIEKLKCDILGDFQTLCKCVLRIQSFIKIGQRTHKTQVFFNIRIFEFSRAKHVAFR